MREEIEKVIAALKDEAIKTYRERSIYRDDPYMLGVLDGRHTIATIAINKLKEVLATESNDTRNPAKLERNDQRQQEE